MSTTKSTADQIEAILGTAFKRSDEIIAKKEAALEALKADIKAAKKARDGYFKKGDVKKAKEADEATKKAEKALDDAENAAAEKASKIADAAAETLRSELNGLREQVEGIVKGWGFGSKRDKDGLPVPEENSWAATVEESLNDHDDAIRGKDGKSGLIADVAKALTVADKANVTAENALKALETNDLKGNLGKTAFWAAGAMLATLTLFMIIFTANGAIWSLAILWAAILAVVFGLVAGLITYGVTGRQKNHHQD